MPSVLYSARWGGLVRSPDANCLHQSRARHFCSQAHLGVCSLGELPCPAASAQGPLLFIYLSHTGSFGRISSEASAAQFYIKCSWEVSVARQKIWSLPLTSLHNNHEVKAMTFRRCYWRSSGTSWKTWGPRAWGPGWNRVTLAKPSRVHRTQQIKLNKLQCHSTSQAHSQHPFPSQKEDPLNASPGAVKQENHAIRSFSQHHSAEGWIAEQETGSEGDLSGCYHKSGWETPKSWAKQWQNWRENNGWQTPLQRGTHKSWGWPSCRGPLSRITGQ